MIKFIFPLFILLSIFGRGFAQERSIQVIENKGNPKSITLDKPDNSLTDRQLLLVHYSNNGFFDAEIYLIDSETYTVNTGEKYKISSLVFEHDIDTINTYEELMGEFYSSVLIEKRITEEYNKIVDEGYYEANVSVKEIDIDSLSKTVSIIAFKEKGKLTKLNEVIFKGNSINSQQYLARISGIKDSLIATQINLNQIKRNLASSELLEEVSDPIIYSEEGKFIVLFNVQERNLNQLDGLIGFVPDASGKGQIVGDLDISLWNVLRDGNAFELQYQRLKPETSRLELGVSQHWIANIPLSIGLDFSFYQNDTTYQTRKIGLNSSYSITSNLDLDGRIYSQTSNSSEELQFQQEPDGEKQGADLGFTFSNLDRVEVPQKGIHLELLYGIANKDIERDSVLSFRQQRIETEIRFYFPIANQSVIASSLHGFYVLGRGITESDLIRFGGANSLRGYSEEQFTASELLWGDVEYRFLTDRNSFLFVFGAAGYYNRSELATEQNATFAQSDFLYSGGIGLSYKTAIGRLKFSYALSPSETIGNGKVHFGIRTGF